LGEYDFNPGGFAAINFALSKQGCLSLLQMDNVASHSSLIPEAATPGL
jgi:hypothetical protein